MVFASTLRTHRRPLSTTLVLTTTCIVAASSPLVLVLLAFSFSFSFRTGAPSAGRLDRTTPSPTVCTVIVSIFCTALAFSLRRVIPIFCTASFKTQVSHMRIALFLSVMLRFLARGTNILISRGDSPRLLLNFFRGTVGGRRSPATGGEETVKFLLEARKGLNCTYAAWVS